jgi:hypothetical protein
MSDLAELRTLGANCHIVRIGDLLILFSYETAVAFNRGGDWIASENIWSNTTGKHIAKVVPKGDKRYPYPAFADSLANTLRELVKV